MFGVSKLKIPKGELKGLHGTSWQCHEHHVSKLKIPKGELKGDFPELEGNAPASYRFKTKNPKRGIERLQYLDTREAPQFPVSKLKIPKGELKGTFKAVI